MDVVSVPVVVWNLTHWFVNPLSAMVTFTSNFRILCNHIWVLFFRRSQREKEPLGVDLMGGPCWSLQAAFAKATCGLAELGVESCNVKNVPLLYIEMYMAFLWVVMLLVLRNTHTHIYRTYGLCTTLIQKDWRETGNGTMLFLCSCQDIMITLTQRLHERDETIISLQAKMGFLQPQIEMLRW